MAKKRRKAPILPDNLLDEYTIPESRAATEGEPVSDEYCYHCGRNVKTDQYKKGLNGKTVYFCSKMCYELNKLPQKWVPTRGIGQTISRDKIAQIRSQGFVEETKMREEKRPRRILYAQRDKMREWD